MFVRIFTFFVSFRAEILAVVWVRNFSNIDERVAGK